MAQKRIMTLLACVCLFVLAACSSESQTISDSGYVTLTPLPPTRLSLPATNVLATNRPAPSRQDITPEPPPVSSCQEHTLPSNPRYEIVAVLDWTTHTMQVEQRITYYNSSRSSQQTVVFNIENNQEPEQFVLKRVVAGDDQLIEDFTLEDRRLLIPLPDDLEVGCEVGLVLEYALTLPVLQEGYSQGRAGYHLGYWGYSRRQTNLGLWFPLIAPFDPVQDWITPRYHWIGENTALQMADFTVELRIDGVPDDVRVAGPGAVTHTDDHTWRFELSGARELALSISDQFRMLSTETETGVDVELFYFPDPAEDTLDTPRHALQTAADALTLFEELYGPYPHSRMVIVQGDFPDGMEFSGLVFVSEAWFRTWKHRANDWLTIITAHEVAHQWWYALVGNDQANDPYLDEALAIYSEALFFEHFYPQHLAWWWQFRVEKHAPTGYVDSPVYDFQSVRRYINAVYLRGALMMDALRHDLGDAAFFTWLRRYRQEMEGRVATPVDFWGTLSSHEYLITQNTRASYLRQANVLSQAAEIP